MTGTLSTDRQRVMVAAPLDRTVHAIHHDWHARLYRKGQIHEHAGPGYGSSTESKLMAILVSDLLTGVRTAADPPVARIGFIRMTPEVGTALIEVLREWRVAASVMAAAQAVIGDPQ